MRVLVSEHVSFIRFTSSIVVSFFRLNNLDVCTQAQTESVCVRKEGVRERENMRMECFVHPVKKTTTIERCANCLCQCVILSYVNVQFCLDFNSKSFSFFFIHFYHCFSLHFSSTQFSVYQSIFFSFSIFHCSIFSGSLAHCKSWCLFVPICIFIVLFSISGYRKKIRFFLECWNQRLPPINRNKVKEDEK